LHPDPAAKVSPAWKLRTRRLRHFAIQVRVTIATLQQTKNALKQCTTDEFPTPIFQLYTKILGKCQGETRMKEDFFAGISNKALKVASWAVISEAGKIVLKIWYWNFEFVSNFDIRISDLYAIRYTHDAILQIIFFDFSVECSFADA